MARTVTCRAIIPGVAARCVGKPVAHSKYCSRHWYMAAKHISPWKATRGNYADNIRWQYFWQAMEIWWTREHNAKRSAVHWLGDDTVRNVAHSVLRILKGGKVDTQGDIAVLRTFIKVRMTINGRRYYAFPAMEWQDAADYPKDQPRNDSDPHDPDSDPVWTAKEEETTP